MKTKNVWKGFAVLLAVALCGCSDETSNDPKQPPQEKGTPQEVTLVVKPNAKDPVSRAETYPSSSEESFILDKKVNLYVYNTDGVLEFSQEGLQLDALNKAKVTLKIGEKYFYVFANVSGSANSDAAATEEKDFNTAYERQLISVDFGTEKDVPDLTKPNFILGTLWREKKEIKLGMTEPIELNIGRIVAKVKLTGVSKGLKSVMKGDFTEPNYRIASVPTQCYWVGQYDHKGWTLLPPPGDINELYGAVTSAVHTQGPMVQGSPNPLFYHYPTYVGVTAMSDPLDNYFYVIENTTAKDMLTSYQYYGNTTHVRLRTVYEPTKAETYDKTLQNNDQDLTGKTFWTVIHNGVRYITNEEPAAGLADDGTVIKHYVDGQNYHKFAIKDTKQNDVEKRHSVYRNHFYQMSVTGIRDLGEPDDIIDPEEPIPAEEEVDISVIVIDWSKITQEEEL